VPVPTSAVVSRATSRSAARAAPAVSSNAQAQHDG
jgi:hypothetical protein